MCYIEENYEMCLLQRRVVNNRIDNTVTFQGLDPSTRYLVTGVVRNGELESTPITQTAQTGEQGIEHSPCYI